MTMKLLAIQTSPNHDGLTASSAKQFLHGAEQSGHETELIHLNDHVIKKCKACEGGWGQCRSKGTCILEDDFEEIRNKIVESDALILATPVYWHDLSESAKTFLDRLRRCENFYNFERFKGKKSVGIASAGGSGNGAARALYLLEEYLKRLNFTTYDLVTLTQANKPHKLPMLQNAGKLLSK
jgi:multimeric flavodoxin WrbA